MDDLIRRKGAIDAMCELMHHWFGSDAKDEIREIKRELGKLPAVEPERKKGKWLLDNIPGGGFWVCSVCKFPSEAFAANVLYKFCPSCGADMRGKQDESEE